MTRKHILAIYSDRESKASPSPIDQEMRRSFGTHADIRLTNQTSLADADFFQNLSMFVLPGIEGETSLYHDHIGPHNQRIRDFVAKGGVFFGQCAGACYATKGTYFTPEWAKPRERLSGLLNLFNGHAHGPLPDLGVNGEDPQFYRGLTSVNTLIEAGDFSHVMPLIYSSGPTFVPEAGQSYHTHARYADIAGQPPAVISFQYGRGLVILSGPVPQNGATPPTGIKAMATLDALLERVRPYEQGRIQFFDSLMNLARAHLQNTGLRPQ